MKLRQSITALLFMAVSSLSWSDLEPYKDYQISDKVISMTTVKVDANMRDVYLEGLRDTWVPSNEIAKELGQIADYKILASELPLSGEFNLVLVVFFDKASDLEPSKKAYDAFMAKWSKEMQKKADKKTKSYPDIRELTGEYRLREVTFSK